MGIEIRHLVNAWLGSSNAPQTGLPLAFFRTAFETGNRDLYTTDATRADTPAFEIVRATMSRLHIHLNAERGKDTGLRSHWGMRAVWEHPARRFMFNDKGGVAIFTELASPDHPQETVPFFTLAQSAQPSDELLEAHQYAPVFTVTGRYTRDEKNHPALVVGTLHRQTSKIEPTDINTLLSLAAADICFHQLQAGQPMDMAAAEKIADQMSLAELQRRFDVMAKPAAPRTSENYPALRQILIREVK